MKLTDIVNVNGKYFLVDTCFTFDAGWESMAFPCTKDGDVISWGDVACTRYDSQDQARLGHYNMVENLASMMY